MYCLCVCRQVVATYINRLAAKFIISQFITTCLRFKVESLESNLLVAAPQVSSAICGGENTVVQMIGSLYDSIGSSHPP